MDPRAQVRSFLSELLAGKGDTLPLADTDSVVLSGRLASVDVLEIIDFLEDRFGIDFAATGFDQADLDSVEAIMRRIGTGD